MVRKAANLLAWFATCAVIGVAVGGCVYDRPIRPISMEIQTPEGHWRLEGIGSATLEATGWRIRILDSQVATAPKVPYLEKLVLEIENTSATLPLVLEPGQVKLTGMAGPIALGPDRRVVLSRSESHVIEYHPGLRAPPVPYPFCVGVTVFRNTTFQDPQAVKLVLY
jgi:hypothetical protein